MNIHQFSYRLNPGLTAVLRGLDGSELGDRLAERLNALISATALRERPDPAIAFPGHRAVLLALHDGVGLTAAGYLPPAVVRGVAPHLPVMAGWLGTIRGERTSLPVLLVREHLQSVRLLRKRKGSIATTRRGAECAASPDALWKHLVETLIPVDDEFVEDASALILLHMADDDEVLSLDDVCRALNELGWRRKNGDPIAMADVHWLLVRLVSVVRNVWPHDHELPLGVASSESLMFIRDVLLEPNSTGSILEVGPAARGSFGQEL